MPDRLTPLSFFETPAAALEHYIALSASRTEPVPVDSEEGRLLYRALAQLVWANEQRPVVAADIRDLWERIDTIKRGSPVQYGIYGIHFWAADYANSVSTDAVAIGPEANQRLAAWLDDWPNICVLGQTGRGKSTTINRLFGSKMAQTSHHKACTSTVTDYRLVTGTFMNRPTGVVLWDVPGYGDGRLPWNAYVKLYRRMAAKCDVVLFMLDHERTLPDDLKMFKKLRKRVLDKEKIVVCINKADLFHPGDWDERLQAPGAKMAETLAERIGVVSEALDLRGSQRVVAISALRNWNLYALIECLVDAAGQSRAPNLLRALSKMAQNTDAKASDTELSARFGINKAMRTRFRRVLVKAQKKHH